MEEQLDVCRLAPARRPLEKLHCLLKIAWPQLKGLLCMAPGASGDSCGAQPLWQRGWPQPVLQVGPQQQLGAAVPAPGLPVAQRRLHGHLRPVQPLLQKIARVTQAAGEQRHLADARVRQVAGVKV